MYGVIFIIEEIKFNPDLYKKSKETLEEKVLEKKDDGLDNIDNINEYSKSGDNVTLENDESTTIKNNLVADQNLINNSSTQLLSNLNNSVLADEDIVDTSSLPSICEINKPDNMIATDKQDKLSNYKETSTDAKTKQNEEELSSKKEGTKSIDHSLNSKQFNLFGPFLGQVIGTVKDCCRKAFLNGEPRLYEAIYLCLFQVKIENIGKIHSVINKRRGTVI